LHVSSKLHNLWGVNLPTFLKINLDFFGMNLYNIFFQSEEATAKTDWQRMCATGCIDVIRWRQRHHLNGKRKVVTAPSSDSKPLR